MKTPLTVRQKIKEREKATKFWAGLSNADRWTLGDQMVQGDVDWRDWGFEKRPTTTFKNELDQLRMYWEGEDERENPPAKLRVDGKVKYHGRTWRVVDISRAGAYAPDPKEPKLVHLVSDDADEIRETVPASTLLWGTRGRNPLEALRLMNPAAPAAAARKYRTFHEVEPHTVTERTCWVPGELVLVGAGVEINYKVNVVDSAKDNGASYVHQFENNVKIYRRARAGESPDEVWKNFPGELSVLGYALEFSFVDPTDGETYETKPAQHDKLATTPDGKTLVIVGSSGVKFVARGGKMKVTNWIYH